MRFGAIALVMALAACGEDPLFREAGRDAGTGPASTDDAGSDLPLARKKQVWFRVPSSGGLLESPEHKVRVRFPPPAAYGRSSSPEHGVSSVLGGAR